MMRAMEMLNCNTTRIPIRIEASRMDTRTFHQFSQTNLPGPPGGTGCGQIHIIDACYDQDKKRYYRKHINGREISGSFEIKSELRFQVGIEKGF